MPPLKMRPDQGRLLNQLIDRTLSQPTQQHRDDLLAWASTHDTQRLAERVRRRATWLGRHQPGLAHRLLTRRDELIMTLYADRTPAGWGNAWCDGSSSGRGSELHAGIGAVLLDASGKRISETRRYVGRKTAFQAELTALTEVLEIALAHNIEQLRVHTDSKALVQLWHQQRQDPRLEPVRLLGCRFKRLHIRAIPRLHNQLANALAKQASCDQPAS